jgi:hypothetical protein
MPKTAIFIVDALTFVIFTTMIMVAIQLNDQTDPVARIAVFLPCVPCLGLVQATLDLYWITNSFSHS